MVAGFRTTWGAFSYPFIFILTDLTTRLYGPIQARRMIFSAMLPGLFLSFFISNGYTLGSLFAYDSIPLRIALASFVAYVVGQLSDIILFQRLRQKKQWWIAPSVATVFGNIIDTYCFFFIAFFHGKNFFISQHWIEIATVDLVFKILISLLTTIPFYGLILAWMLRKSNHNRLIEA